MDIDELSAKVEAMGNVIAEEHNDNLAMIVVGLNEEGETDHTFGFVIGKRGLLVGAIVSIFDRHPELLQDVLEEVGGGK